MDVLGVIKKRRSVRKFKKHNISSKTMLKILEAGRWAPSGLNNQPWRFKVLEKQNKDSLATYTHYAHIIKSADKAILVFLDKSASYNKEKDLMAIGASIQNMLICIHALGLGACWLGEILNKREELCRDLKIPKNLELEAVIALGKPISYPKKASRKSLDSLILK